MGEKKRAKILEDITSQLRVGFRHISVHKG